MTDPAFISGLIVGFGGQFGWMLTAFLLKQRRAKREIPVWTEENYQAPTVTTRVLIRERNFEL